MVGSSGRGSSLKGRDNYLQKQTFNNHLQEPGEHRIWSGGDDSVSMGKGYLSCTEQGLAPLLTSFAIVDVGLPELFLEGVVEKAKRQLSAGRSYMLKPAHPDF